MTGNYSKNPVFQPRQTQVVVEDSVRSALRNGAGIHSLLLLTRLLQCSMYVVFAATRSYLTLDRFALRMTELSRTSYRAHLELVPL